MTIMISYVLGSLVQFYDSYLILRGGYRIIYTQLHTLLFGLTFKTSSKLTKYFNVN